MSGNLGKRSSCSYVVCSFTNVRPGTYPNLLSPMSFLTGTTNWPAGMGAIGSSSEGAIADVYVQGNPRAVKCAVGLESFCA